MCLGEIYDMLKWKIIRYFHFKSETRVSECVGRRWKVEEKKSGGHWKLLVAEVGDVSC